MGKFLTNKEFINFCTIKHGDKYDYSLVDYKGKYSKINIICNIHGVFSQTANEHRHGANCPKCIIDSYKKPKYSNEDIIIKLKEYNNVDFDYSNVNYIKHDIKIKIKCLKHDELFEQEVSTFLKNGTGCKKCQYEKASYSKRLTISDVKYNLNNVHNFKYIYEIEDTFDSRNRIKIICKKHGLFEQHYLNHLQGKGCPKCGNIISKNENELFEFIKLNYKDGIIRGDRKILNGKEIDIYLYDINLGIEFNGLLWHSDKYKDINYHIDKTNNCSIKNTRLVHIFEDEWINKKEIVKSRLLNIIGKIPNKIYARKCIIKEVSSKECSEFLDKNHIQGKLGAKIKLGLYFENELVSIMTFGNLRRNLGQISKEGSYELLRFCNKLNTNVIGGASKLFKYFLKKYNPEKIISYADRRWSQGDLYYKLGFNFVENTQPNYFYTKGIFRENRFKYRKSELIKNGFDICKTENQIMKERGYYRIYDCGTLKFEWKKDSY